MDCALFLEKVREKKPLVHHITNWVTIYDCANIVKVLGAAPVMAHACQEAADMAALSSSLVLNIGTLTEELIEAMKIAGRKANEKKIPVVLDVCGAGATPFRDKKSFELLDEIKVDVVKGNVSEIARLAGEKVITRGVDAGSVDKDIVDIAASLAAARKCLVAVTGQTDIVINSKALYKVYNGHEMMSKVVGTGCMAASVIGAFAGANKDLAAATAAGLCCLGIAAEGAAEQARGPAAFKELLFDSLFSLDARTVKTRQKIAC